MIIMGTHNLHFWVLQTRIFGAKSYWFCEDCGAEKHAFVSHSRHIGKVCLPLGTQKMCVSLLSDFHGFVFVPFLARC